MYVPNIRFCDASDLPDILALNASSPYPWPDAVIVNDMSESSAVGISYLGAFSVGREPRLLGYATLGQEADAGLLMALFVHQAHRRLGIASQLLTAVLSCAAYLEFPRLILRVRESNSAAIALYERMSFIRRGTCRRYYSDGEDAILMGVTLSRRFLEPEA